MEKVRWLWSSLCMETSPHRGEAHWRGWRDSGTRRCAQGSQRWMAQTRRERVGRGAWLLPLQRKWHRWVLPSESPGQGTQGRKEAEEREVWKLGWGSSLAAASHEEPLLFISFVPSGCSSQGQGGEARERYVYLQPVFFFFFFNFHKWVTWPDWKPSVTALAIVSEIGFWRGCVWPVLGLPHWVA